MSSGTITVSVEADGMVPGAVLAADVIALATGDQRVIRVGSGASADIALAPGSYLVRAALPSGQLLSGAVEVAAGATREVRLRPRRPFTPTTKGRNRDRPSELVWARLWCDDQPLSWPDAARDIVGLGELTVALPLLDGADAIEIGGERRARRFLRLPPSRSCRLEIAFVDEAEDFDDGVRVRAWGDDPVAESMLRYLCSGQIASARALIDAGAAPSTDDTELGCVSAYVLARTPKSERFETWIEAGADAELVDRRIVRAWGLLRRPSSEDQALGRELLLSSAADGPPSYTEGLRLQFDALRRAAASDPHDDEVLAAVETVRRYATACDWTAPQTSYWASSPNEPTLRRLTADPYGAPPTWFRVGL